MDTGVVVVRPTNTKETLLDKVKAHKIKHIVYGNVGITGKPICSSVPASGIESFGTNTGITLKGQGNTDGKDPLSSVPDLSTFTPLPWNRELAYVSCNTHNSKGISPLPFLCKFL